MNNNNQNKRVTTIVLVFIGFMFLMPTGIITSIEGFTVFSMIPISMFIFFTVFFLIMVNISNKSTRKANINSGNNLYDKHCPSCHESIEINSAFCPNCGLEQNEYIICDYCGVKNSKFESNCTSCNGLLK